MNIVSFGGGTNSAALLIGLYKHKIPIDLITFADTGAEHPHTYQFIEIINQWLAEHGMPQITVVQYVDRYGNRLSLETECLRSHTLPSIAYGHKRCSPTKNIITATPSLKNGAGTGTIVSGKSKRQDCRSRVNRPVSFVRA